MSVTDEIEWYRHTDNNLSDGFKLAMRRLSATVTIVSTGDEEGSHGLAATAVTSVSAEPAAVLACVNRSAGALRGFAAAQALCHQRAAWR